MGKIRFIIVGSGWRSKFYVRIAKALPERYEVAAMLCRSVEKAEKMAKECEIYTTTSIEECIQMQPDFVVAAVTKTDIARVSMEWMDRGCTVLCETPASLEYSMLEQLWKAHKAGEKLVVAEQYVYYPQYAAVIEALDRNVCGSIHCVNLSVAHEYHGASLMRAFLQESVATPFTVSGKTYTFPTTETYTRYEKFTDGRVADKKRTVATFTFANGKVCWYDFDSEQYRSPIRKNLLKIQGVRGEIVGNRLYYLDEHNEACEEELAAQSELEQYGLSQDEIAIEHLMQLAAQYNRDEVDLEDLLKNALQDSYMAILMQEAVSTGTCVSSQPQIWQ